MAESKTIEKIYVDGSCLQNPGGPGGWGVVVIYNDGTTYEFGGSIPRTTNNKMEIRAALEGIQFWYNSCDREILNLYSDSEYVIKGVTEWCINWQRRGWKTSTGDPVKNQKEWIALLIEIDKASLNERFVRWHHVRGHSKNWGNDRSDEIARSYAKEVCGGRPPQK